MLQHSLIPQLDDDDQEGRIHFQQEGALPPPPHYLGEEREYLNTRFSGRLSDRMAPIAWPLRDHLQHWKEKSFKSSGLEPATFRFLA
jgi:hypothetical protein